MADNATVSLNQVNSAGQVGGCVAVVAPESIKEVEEKDFLLIDTDLKKQAQDFQVCERSAEEQACSSGIVTELRTTGEVGDDTVASSLMGEESTEFTDKQLKYSQKSSKSDDELECLEQILLSEANALGKKDPECKLNVGEPVREMYFTDGSQTEGPKSTEISGGVNIFSSTVEQLVPSENKCSSDGETNIDQIINGSTDYELENVEQYDCEGSDFMEQSDPLPCSEIKSSNEHFASNEKKNIVEYSSNSYGDVDGSYQRQQTGHVKNSETVANKSCSEKVSDEKCAESDNETGHNQTKDTETSKLSAEKIQLLVDSVANNIKVAFKIYKDCSCNSFLPVFFLLVFYCQSNVNTVLKETYAVLNQSVFGHTEQIVFVSVFDSDFLGNGSQFLNDLPYPDLPGLGTPYNGIDNLLQMLGVNLRQAFSGSTNSRESEQSSDSVNLVPDSGVFSLQSRPREVGSNVEMLSLQGSLQNPQNRAGFISILSSPLSVSIREAIESLVNVTSSRIEGIPALQTPSSGQLDLDEDNTGRKIVNSGENLTGTEGTFLFADGNPTTWRSRNDVQVAAADNHSSVTQEAIAQGANSVTGMANQLSTSVSLHSPGDNMSRRNGGLADLQARADTFNNRWPHSHLDPIKMAEAGFYFTGESDIARCFCCKLCLRQWERDDDPMVEHIRHFPDCEYIQSQLHDNPQNFGASNVNAVSQVENTFQNDDLYIGAQGSMETQEGAAAGFSLGMEQQAHSSPLSVRRRSPMFGRRRENYPHGEQESVEQESVESGRTHSEAIFAPSCEGYSQQAESSGIQETEYQSSASWMSTNLLEGNYQSPQMDRGRGAAGQYETYDFDDPGLATATAIDRELVNFHLNSDEVRMVLAEGYLETDLAYVVEAILKEDGIITVDNMKRELRYIGARRQP